MQEKPKRTAKQWIDVLAGKELPAITSVAAMLDKFSNDDISSIPQLSKAILHDQGLSSCVLKVANNTNRISNSKVTTVSRASIVLGIHTIKNICLTSKILDGLLQSKNLGPDVYKRLTNLMANAFYSGLLAKMMLPNYGDDTQEEVYLAAMLYHIGETSFWSSGSQIGEQLIKQVALPANEFQQYCHKVTGIQFKDISIGLAKTWHLGDLLIKSLDQPESRTIEMQTISLSNQLSAAIACPPENKSEFQKILKNVSNVMGIDVAVLKERIEETRKLAIKLLASYGASVLEKHIKKLPKEIDFVMKQGNLSNSRLNQEKALLSAIKELSNLAKKRKNIKEFLTFTVQQIAQIFDFELCSFWILSKDKNSLESRMSVDNKGYVINAPYRISLNTENNIVNQVFKMKEALLVNDYHTQQWQKYATYEITKLINNGAICFAPLIIADKTIGLITAQVLDSSETISEEEFSQFSFIVEHLNMCLSMVSNR